MFNSKKRDKVLSESAKGVDNSNLGGTRLVRLVILACILQLQSVLRLNDEGSAVSVRSIAVAPPTSTPTGLAVTRNCTFISVTWTKTTGFTPSWYCLELARNDGSYQDSCIYNSSTYPSGNFL